MKRLLGLLLLMRLVGCGGEDDNPPAGEAASPSTPKNSQVQAAEPPAQALDADLVAVLEKGGVSLEQNEQGQIVEVSSECRDKWQPFRSASSRHE